jgi:Ca2+-binding EF-hand superfamily protein
VLPGLEIKRSLFEVKRRDSRLQRETGKAMGNQVGKGANRMAIAAMSNVTHIEKRELAALLSKFREIAGREGNATMINRTEFAEALAIVGINQNDADILDRLFTMYDKSGDDQINYRDFIVGIAPLISGTHQEKIDFALRLYDSEGTSYMKARDIVNVLSQMNRVASYFGDPVMTEEQIASVVVDVQDMAGGAVDGMNDAVHYVEYIKIIADHPIVNTFITGGGSVQYGMGR